jgi:hypothetical protein
MNDKYVSVELSLKQLMLVYDALTDKVIEWDKTVLLRNNAGEDATGLERNLDDLDDARDEVAKVLRKFGVMRRGRRK